MKKYHLYGIGAAIVDTEVIVSEDFLKKNKKPAYLIDGANDINPAWLNGINSIGITAGASAPEILVQEVVSYLLDNGADEVVEVSGVNENVHFPVPNTLRV